MGDDEEVAARRERRLAGHDRTKSPSSKLADNGGEEEGGTMGDSSARRISAANFSASKLVESLKEANATTISRLRRTASSDGMARPSGEGPPRTRRPIGRTMSAQQPRAPQRRLRAGDNDVLSQSLVDNFGSHNDDMDNSTMSASQGGRRRVPQRTKSAQDSGFPRAQRMPRARRKPNPDREDSTEDLNGEQVRRRLPPRSKSAEGFPAPARGIRPSRPGRRRPQAEDAEDIIISDSDEENKNKDDNNIDRSSRRRGAPTRTRSAHDGPRGAQRTSRATRRRPSGDSADASPRRAGGPGLQRSLTGTPPPSSSGPGLMRSQTTTNPRSARVRGGRNTAQELAQVVANRERSPDPSAIEHFNDVGDPRHIGSQHHSNSPIKSRQERRRLREGKEREVLERRMQGQDEMEANEAAEKIKEEPWMRRLKKNVGEKASNEAFDFDKTLGSAHSSGKNDFFPVDPTFGVFPAVSDMPLSTVDADALNDDDGTAPLSMGENKLDFSTIS